MSLMDPDTKQALHEEAVRDSLAERGDLQALVAEFGLDYLLDPNEWSTPPTDADWVEVLVTEISLSDLEERLRVPETRTRFEIPDYRLAGLQAKIAKLAKRAAKLGSDPITLEVVRGPYASPTGGHRRNDSPKGPRLIPIMQATYEVEVHGPKPVIAGWEFLATLEHKQAGTILRTVPTAEVAEGLLDPYRSAGANCDHCKRQRRRKDTYVVRHVETGQVLQVGRTCLRDFTGHDSPESVARMAELLLAAVDACSEGDDDGGWGGGRARECMVEPVEFMTCVLACRAEFGWLSATAARERADGSESTAAQAWTLTLGRNYGLKTRLLKEVEVTAEHAERAAVVLDKAKAALADRDDRSDYEHNLFVWLEEAWVTWRGKGLVASAAGFVDRLENRERAAKVARDQFGQSKHVGVEGERLDLIATVTRVTRTATDWGPLTIVNLLSEDGDALVWFAHDDLPERETPADTPLWVTGTVKRHQADKRAGYPVTALNRVTLSLDADRFRNGTHAPCPSCKAAEGQWCRQGNKRRSALHKRRSKGPIK